MFTLIRKQHTDFHKRVRNFLFVKLHWHMRHIFNGLENYVKPRQTSES